jgi:hypothetical protein
MWAWLQNILGESELGKKGEEEAERNEELIMRLFQFL